MGNCIGISKNHTYPAVGAYRIRPTPRPRRGRKQGGFSKDNTYPVGELHLYFEGSHVPSRRGVLHTPTPRPRRGRKQDRFLKGHTYPVRKLHRYFEESHVPGRRGVSNTLTPRPRKGRRRDIFCNRWWCLVGRMQYVPTLSADKDSINRHAFATSNRQSQGLRFRKTYFLEAIARIIFWEILLSGDESKDNVFGDPTFWR